MNVSSNTAGFGWTVLGNSGNGFLNLINSNYNEDWGSPGILRFNPQSGNQSIDLTGTGNQGDNGLQQTVATTVGVTYDLSFYLGHADDHYTVSYSGPAVIKLSINGLDAGVFSNSVDTLNQVNWALQTYSFVASSNSTRISFLSGTNVNFAGLDTVSLTAESPRVPVISNPEPGTFGLMGAGLGLAALLARKLRRPRVE